MPASTRWCPEEVEPHLPFVHGFTYRDSYSQSCPGPDGWHIVGATRRGRSNAHNGNAREDAFQIFTSNRHVIMCVSDGSAQSKLSRIASEMLCQTIGQRLSARLTTEETSLVAMNSQDLRKAVGQQMHDAGHEAFVALRDLAAKSRRNVNDFRATFLMAVIYIGSKETIILTTQIGDGFMAVLPAGAPAKPFGDGDNGEHPDSTNCLVPDDEAFTKLRKIRTVPDQNIQGLIVATDGVGDAFFPLESRVGEIFAQFTGGTQTSLADMKQTVHGPIVGQDGNPSFIESWLGFEKRGENDDRTIIFAWRTQPEGLKVAAAPSVENPVRPLVMNWLTESLAPRWCPGSLESHLPFTQGFQYRGSYAEHCRGPDGWQIVGATRCGDIHSQLGEPREDAFQILGTDRYAIICMSDGNGAARLGRICSEMMCRVVSQNLAANFQASEGELTALDITELRQAVGQRMHDTAREAILTLKNAAAKAWHEDRDFYATFLMAVIYCAPSGTAFLTSQIGNGFMAVRYADGKTERHGGADSGQYSDVLDCLIPNEKAFQYLRRIRQVPDRNIQGFLLGTSGVESAFRPIDQHAGTIFEQFLQGVQTNSGDLKQPIHGPILGTNGNPMLIEKWLDYERQGEEEDRTLVIAWRNPDLIPDPAPPAP
jgi:serine/threonine protein phosphatase PrpC